MNTHLKQLWAAMKLPEKLQKSYKFFCRGLDIRVVQIMKTTAAGIARKVEVEMEIATMIAAKRYEQRIMLVIPFLIIGYLRMVNQSYICILYEGVAGRIVMTLCLLAGIISYFWSRKLINIGV